MDPATSLIAAKSTLAEATTASGAKEASLQLTRREVQKLAPVNLVQSQFLEINAIVQNVPLGEQTASFFSAPEFRQLAFIKRPDVEGVQIRLGDKEFYISLKDSGLLDDLGVKSAIQYALSPALDQIVRIRLSELHGLDAPIVPRLKQPNLPTPLAVAVRAPDAGEFLAQLERESRSLEDLQSPRWFEATRIDYLVGDQYVEGRICRMPIVGGISNWVFKSHLDLSMERKDWAKVGEDVVMIISIAAIPCAPMSGWLAMSGWVAANAAFGAVTQGAISCLNDQDRSIAMANAGKGALLGAVSGLAGVAAVAKVAPAVSNQLLAATVSGATVGSATSAANATIRVIEKGEDLSVAAKEIAVETLVGGTLGGGIGAASFGVSQVATKLSVSRLPMSGGEIIQRAERFEKWQKKVEPMLPQERNLHMGDIRAYSKQLDEQLEDFSAYLKASDPTFSSHVETLGHRFAEAIASRDVEAVAKLNRDMKTRLSGELAEAFGVAKFRPFFEKLTVQNRVQDGATIIDAVFEGAKRPLAIKGHRYVEKGGMLPVEFKAGTERYFKSQIESGHLLKQVGGHQEFGNGLVVTTHDVTNPLLETGNARRILKEAGSTVYRFLPHKSTIDDAVARLVRG